MDSKVNTVKSYLSPKTKEQHDFLSGIPFEKKEPLQVHIVEKGIVIPYDSTITPPAGGVINNNELDSFSISSFYNPIFHDFSIRTGNIPVDIGKVECVDDEIIYIGDVDSFFGHFLTNSLTRLWILFNPEFLNYKVCYIGKDPSSSFIEAFYLFGIKKENLVYINKPTMFSKVIIPEPSYRYWDYWHMDFKRTFDKIRSNVQKKYNYPKIYFSRSTYFGASGTFGEIPIEKIFKKNGFRIIHPDSYTFSEKIAMLSNCKVLAGLSGTGMHNALFCNDNVTCYILNRSPCIIPVQIQIDQMKKINSYYIDAYLDLLPTLDCAFPYLVGLNNELKRFFEDNSMRFSLEAFSKDLPNSLYNYMYYWNKQVISSNLNYYIVNKYSPNVNMLDIAKEANSALANYLPIKQKSKKEKFFQKLYCLIFYLPRKIVPKKIKKNIRCFLLNRFFNK